MSQSMCSWHESAWSKIASAVSKQIDSQFNDSSTDLVQMERESDQEGVTCFLAMNRRVERTVWALRCSQTGKLSRTEVNYICVFFFNTVCFQPVVKAVCRQTYFADTGAK